MQVYTISYWEKEDLVVHICASPFPTILGTPEFDVLHLLLPAL